MERFLFSLGGSWFFIIPLKFKTDFIRLIFFSSFALKLPVAHSSRNPFPLGRKFG
jgi:hypothetical protein